METTNEQFPFDVCVIGGCGHVGLPLAITFASEGLRVSVYDTNDRAIETVRAGNMPFMEPGAEPVLRDVVNRSLHVANDPALVAQSRHVVVVIGTPVDEHLNPAFNVIRGLFSSLMPHFRPGQCVILRSTVFPGTTARVRDLLAAAGHEDVHVAFCPERVAEGHAMTELRSLPQIVTGCDDRAAEMASALFGRIAKSVIRMEPLEAELTKIFANVWRYIQFATANQFFMIASDYGLDFYKLHDALTKDYPRMAGLPKSGFAAGPCLFKDTMQLAAAYDNNFWLGHAAMLVNEGLPAFVVRQLKQRHDLRGRKVGVLGMAFKAESDDRRESLSYKLRKLLEYEAADVRCTDPYVGDADLVPVDEVVAWADVLVLGAPHKEYASLEIPERTLVVDIWNFYGKGTRFE